MVPTRAFAAFALLFILVAAGPPAGAQAPLPTADTLFDNQVLQRIDLTINSRDWLKLKATFQENTYYTTTITWRGQVMRNAWVRSRGSGSRSATKPGLRVDFNRNAAGAQEWLGLKSLVLDNLAQDPSGMHEMLATRLFERMGLPAPREAFAQLFVNNQFAGLYAVVEPIDKRFLARVFGEHDGNTENDGYLYEYNWTYPYLLTYLGPELERYQEIFEPKTHETDSMAALYSPLHLMVREINQARDDLFETNVSKYLDLPGFMKYVAVQSALAEWDGLLGYAGINNFYLYRFEKKDLSQFLVWDADNSFRAIDYSIVAEHDNNVLMRRAMQIQSLRAVYFNALLAAAASTEEFSDEEAEADRALGLKTPRGWLEREIDRLSAQIAPWERVDAFDPFTYDEFTDAVAYMKQFSHERGPYVRCEVAKITTPAQVARLCSH
jgi:spore coat protein CotH